MRVAVFFRIVGISLGLVGFSTGVLSAENLISEKSDIRFISVKNAAIAEVHHFGNLQGNISENGKVVVAVPLADVETMIPIRNERMRQLFFDIATFPRAEISAEVDMSRVMALENGGYTTIDVTFTLNLHGNHKQLNAPVTVARLGDELHVTTIQPLILNVADFQLTDGVERLRNIAGLKSISTAIPVSATLVFNR